MKVAFSLTVAGASLTWRLNLDKPASTGHEANQAAGGLDAQLDASDTSEEPADRLPIGFVMGDRHGL